MPIVLLTEIPAIPGNEIILLFSFQMDDIRRGESFGPSPKIEPNASRKSFVVIPSRMRNLTVLLVKIVGNEADIKFIVR